MVDLIDDDVVEPLSGELVVDGEEVAAEVAKIVAATGASGPGDIAVLDEATGTLFAGGLLDAARVPDIQDSELPAWHRALASLRSLHPATVVPGHGSASSAALIDTVEGYLAALEARMRALVTAGTSLLEVPDAGELPAYERWDQYELVHRRNASIAFLRFERELLFKQ